MANKRLLIIFVRHPELGKVKTRLPRELGDEKALVIYEHLLQHTRTITGQLEVDKVVYYAGEVQKTDTWDNRIYSKKAQSTGDLGTRMKAAFATAFAEGYGSAVIIGSDCLQLDTVILEQAFDALETEDVVIGPAKDGGYYLLGMNRLYPQLFLDKPWSTSAVFPLTLADIEAMKLSYALLPVLSDIDRVEDVDAALLSKISAGF